MSPSKAMSDTNSGQTEVTSTVIRKLASRFIQRTSPAVQRRIDTKAFAERGRAKVIMYEITGRGNVEAVLDLRAGEGEGRLGGGRSGDVLARHVGCITGRSAEMRDAFEPLGTRGSKS